MICCSHIVVDDAWEAKRERHTSNFNSDTRRCRVGEPAKEEPGSMSKRFDSVLKQSVDGVAMRDRLGSAGRQAAVQALAAINDVR